MKSQYMRICIIFALLFFCVFSRAKEAVLPEFGGVEPTGSTDHAGAPVAGTDAGELRKVKDNLSASLFFRGELADAIIEANLQDRLVPVAAGDSHADIKLKLLDWIRKNTDEAAELYLYLKTSGADSPSATHIRHYSWYTYKINPRFLELAAAVNKAAGDGAIPDEEAGLIAGRLFSGPQVPASAYAPQFGAVQGSGGVSAPQGAGSAAALDYASYKLNPAGAEREARFAAGLVEGLKNALEKDATPGSGGEYLAESRRLSEAGFALYRQFIVALSALKGRRNITEAESRNLEKLRGALRTKLNILAARIALGRLRARAEALPAGAPGADILAREALELQAAFEALVSGAEKDGEEGKAARQLFELQKAADFWTFRFSAYMRLVSLKSRIEGTGFSCVLDRVVFEWLVWFAPASGYARLKRELTASASAIESALEGVAAGDYGRTALFAGGSQNALSDKMEEIKRKLSVLEDCSRFNGRLQFLFWDAFLNPAGLEPAAKGIAARNKLMYYP